jgi:hypothetical protein
MSLLTEQVGDETLVYDTEEHQAYLVPSSLTIPRRAALKALVAAGIAIVVAAPTVAEAASCKNAVPQCVRGDVGRTCVRSNGACGRCLGRDCI